MIARRALPLLALGWVASSAAASVELRHAGIVHDPAGAGETTQLAADMLAGDLAALGAVPPHVGTDLRACGATCIVIGRYDAPLIARLARDGGVDLSVLRDGWERYVRAVVRVRGQRILLIAGSDRRGAVYGTVDLSRALGISPWAWWARSRSLCRIGPLPCQFRRVSTLRPPRRVIAAGAEAWKRV